MGTPGRGSSHHCTGGTERIPNRIALPTTVARAGALSGRRPRLDALAAGALAAVVLGVALAWPDALGMGDVKLALPLAVGLDGDAPWPLMLGLVFEHFCSPEDDRAERQNELYRGLFARIGSVLPDKGRSFLQTMVFRAEHDPGRADRHPRAAGFRRRGTSRSWAPGSRLLAPPWPGADHSQRRAALPPRVEHERPARYIETIRLWRKRFAAPSLKKALLKLQRLPRWLTSPDFRPAFTAGVSANRLCLERELLDHNRLVFEKKLRRLVDRQRRLRPVRAGGVSSDWGRVTGSGPRAG